ncbi:hypothetical protein HYV86_04105 [Candidatus Woesearchaeota archaeon]|nr:hypothetical protein [Candidatus Woesearchaeota archaeon]
MNNNLNSIFTKEELALFKRLNTPQKIQDYLDLIPINFEADGETYMSAKKVLERNIAHCFEAALLAAAILRYHGQKPLILDLETKGDTDHVVTLFQQNGRWGAISKTNHSVLRYRDPIYKSVRELVMSYFHEYFTNADGKKRLRAYKVVDLTKWDKENWMGSDKDLWNIIHFLENSKHIHLMDPVHVRRLRPASRFEIKVGELVEWEDPADAVPVVSKSSEDESCVSVGGTAVIEEKKPSVLTLQMKEG